MNEPGNLFRGARKVRRFAVAAVFAAWFVLPAVDARPDDASQGERFFQWGGEIKTIGAASWPGSGTLVQPQGDETFFDGLAEGRLKGRFFFTGWLNLEVHNVTGATGGDTRKAVSTSSFPVFLGQGDIPGSPPSDSRQLFTMSWNPVNHDDFVFYDRVDRLALTFKKGPVLLSLGRQAITWGNGQIFNPMDLINPFSPTDVVREYKVGQDAAFGQASAGNNVNLQLLYAPRREPGTSRVEEVESAYASRLHLVAGKTEFDVMAAKNFGDRIAGAGVVGYLGDTVWRADATWTWPREGGHGYLSAVANIDYSWRWGGKNWYAFVELFYSGIGEKNVSSAFMDPDIQRLINEGVLFTLGQWYADGSVRIELHPLFNVYLTVISNVVEPSWIVQPRINWDFAPNFRLSVWGNIAIGPKGTEYGGFEVAGTNLERKPPDGAFVWLSYYF